MTPREIRALIDARVDEALSSSSHRHNHTSSSHSTSRSSRRDTARQDDGDANGAALRATVEGLHDDVLHDEVLRELLDAPLREAAREQQRAMGNMRATLERDHARDVAALRDEVTGREMTSASRGSLVEGSIWEKDRSGYRHQLHDNED